jgi:O-methyltransferase involved in polyketide biosynthesis
MYLCFFVLDGDTQYLYPPAVRATIDRIQALVRRSRQHFQAINFDIR